MTAVNPFKKAVKEKLFGRVAIIGLSGGGKTYSALRLATGMVPEGKSIAFIDTERGSAAKYSDKFSFDVLELTNFDPANYIRAISAAKDAGYPVLVIDSLSHAWFGAGGALEKADQAAVRSGGNKFAGWRDVTPLHNKLMDAIIAYPGHVIVCMRAKTEYALEKDDRTGKMAPKKIGLAPIQRAGLEYEFDLVGDIDVDHNWIITKTRCPDFDGAVVREPDEDTGKRFLSWLNSGEGEAKVPAPVEHAEAAPATPALPSVKPAAPQPAEPEQPAPQSVTPAPGVKYLDTVVKVHEVKDGDKTKFGIQTKALGPRAIIGTYSEEMAEVARDALASSTPVDITYSQEEGKKPVLESIEAVK